MGEQERFPVSSAVRQRRKEERKATDNIQPALKVKMIKLLLMLGNANWFFFTQKPQGYLE